MQLGTRWRFGTTPPNRLSANVTEALAEAEHTLAANAANTGYDLTMDYWTLTWLEGRSVCEFDDGTRLVEEASGLVSITHRHSEVDDSAPSHVTRLPDTGNIAGDDEDDGWLRG